MNTKRVLLFLALFIIPLNVVAAPLTDSQARSLIAVVQSSPETPAGAFTELITAFSNITIKQAESLITVVQAAPGVAPDAFVSMLVAFTEDTQTDRVVAIETRVETVEKQVQQITQPTFGGIIQETMEDPTPTELQVTFVGGSKPDTETGIPNGYLFETFNWRVSVLDQYGNYLESTPVSVEFPADALYPKNSLLTPEEDSKTNPSTNKVTNGQSGRDTKDWSTTFEYVPTTPGEKTIVFTSGGLSKTVTATVK